MREGYVTDGVIWRDREMLREGRGWKKCRETWAQDGTEIRMYMGPGAISDREEHIIRG